MHSLFSLWTKARLKQPAASPFFLFRSFFIVTATLMAVGCSSAHYRKKADEEAYAIVKEMEKRIFGKYSDFSIETRFSHRDPEDVPAPEIIDERMMAGAIKLTLPEAIRLGTEHNRNYQSQRENLYLEALTLSDRRFVFSPQFFGGSSPRVVREVDGDIRGEVNNSQVGVSQFMKTGGRLSAAVANDLLRYFTGDPRREAVSILTLNFAQPLLRGAGAAVVAENLTQAERNVIYQIRDFTQFQREFAVGVVSEYYSLLQRKDTIRNNYRNYLSRKTARQRAEAQLRAQEGFLGSPKDRDLAVQSELNARNTYINSVNSYNDAINSFVQNTLSLPVGSKIYLDDTAFETLEKVGLQPINLDLDEGYKMALQYFLPLLNEIDSFEDSKRKIKVASNNLKADIDFTSSASLNWDKEENYLEFDVDEITANAGLNIDLPFNRLGERNNYRRTIITFERAIRSLAQNLDAKRTSIDNGLRALRNARENYKNQYIGVIVADRRVKEQEARAEAGNVDQQTLIDAQDDLIRSQNNKTQSLVSYLNTRLDLLLELGIIDTDVEDFWLKKPELLEDDEPPFFSTQMDKLLAEPLPTPEQIFAEPAL